MNYPYFSVITISFSLKKGIIQKIEKKITKCHYIFLTFIKNLNIYILKGFVLCTFDLQIYRYSLYLRDENFFVIHPVVETELP